VKPLKWKRLKSAVLAFRSMLDSHAGGGPSEMSKSDGFRRVVRVWCALEERGKSTSVWRNGAKCRGRWLGRQKAECYSPRAETLARLRKEMHAYKARGLAVRYSLRWCSQPSCSIMQILGAGIVGSSYSASQMLTKWL
jgi:hypothetical protein